MDIKSIKVEKLFGKFNHTVNLSPNNRIAIIYGLNGVGKTVFLKMISSCIGGNLEIFSKIPFERFSIEHYSGKIIEIRRELVYSVEAGVDQQVKIIAEIVSPDGIRSEIIMKMPYADIPSSVLDRIDRHVPGPFSRFGNGWRDPKSNIELSLSDIVKKFPFIQPRIPEKYRQATSQAITEGLNVFIVEASRLTTSDNAIGIRNRANDLFIDDEDVEVVRSRVVQYSIDIVQAINTALDNYTKTSQKLDSEFPEKLVALVREGLSPSNPKEILTQLLHLKEKREVLMERALLTNDVNLVELTEEDVNRAPEALSLYVDHTRRKLNELQETSSKIGLFLEILNRRLKFKKAGIDRENGIIITSDDKTKIPLDSLSSGEQNEIVMIYELLFMTSRNSLVLVDEPEISLHIAWQYEFLKDFQEVLSATESYGIIATHSPAIIGGNWDLATELGNPYIGEASNA